MNLSGSDILKLADLLKPSNADSDSDDDVRSKTLLSMNPGDVGPKCKDKITGNTTSKVHLTTIKKQTKDIWDKDELNQGSEFNDSDDPRLEPKYEMLYKQAVTTEDMYLQMGNKTNSSASCENLIVKIYLPGTKVSEINLDVKESFLDCRTPKYKLGLYLPHPNESKNAKAQWNEKENVLSVTLKLIREYDEFNF